MPKTTRGLPEKYSIDLPHDFSPEPVQLGAYLEDEAAPMHPTRIAVVQSPPREPDPATVPQSTAIRRSPAAPPPQRPVVMRAETPEPSREGLQYHQGAGTFFRRVSRKQLNLNPETLRMVDELLDQIRSQSVQKDAKASEMFHALVAALYEARELLNLSDIPPRGRWGRPTAFAFPVALKTAFQTAIADWCARNRF